MDDLKEEFDKAYDSTNKLDKLLNRIARIKVFDPAFMRKSSLSCENQVLAAIAA